MWGQLSTTCSNTLKRHNGDLLVAVNHNQLRTLASETVDTIDWSPPPPTSWAVPPDRLVHCTNQCNLRGNLTCNRSIRGNHLAYAASQVIVFYGLEPPSGESTTTDCGFTYELLVEKWLSATCWLNVKLRLKLTKRKMKSHQCTLP